MKQKTLIILKPDCVERKLIGTVLAYFEGAGLETEQLQMLRLCTRQAEALYEEHRGKDFFDRNVAFVTSGPVIAAVLSGKDAVKHVRDRVMVVRRAWATSTMENLVHASDSAEAAAREMDVIWKWSI